MGVLFYEAKPKNKYVFGAIAQLGERRPCKAEVNGSIPFSSTNPAFRVIVL
jgi:hypothetical protein